MSEPDAKDVAEALAITFEREDAVGAPWCPPHDAQALTRWVTDRSRELGGAIRRAVRFARLAAAADGRDYVRFLYVTVPALRARHFSAALTAAAAGGRLPRSVATLDASGARLHEPAMFAQSAAGEGFAIDFAQMPRLAALLDILHNTLGYAPAADLLQPILQRGPPTAHADEVARALHAAFNAWLGARLESPHYLRQARRIRAFLAAHGRVEPEAINDASILSFWGAMAVPSPDEEVEGFRLYTSAARAMLRYRQALFDATGARRLAAPLRIGTGVEDSEVDIERLEAAELDTFHWHSPLTALASSPASAVKWLTKAERLTLANYLGGGDDAQSEGDETGGDPQAGIGLAGAERFDLRFVRTLLRADVFGVAQASLVAQLRRRAPPATATEQALQAISGSAYDEQATAYAGLRDQIRLEALAALHLLLEAGCVEALILIERLGAANAVRTILNAGEGTKEVAAAAAIEGADGGLSAAEGARISAAIQAAFVQPQLLAPEAAGLLAGARTAARKVNRQGFRPQDRTDSEIMRGMRAAAAPVANLLDELERLIAALTPAPGRDDVASDRAIFAAAFRQLYVPATQA